MTMQTNADRSRLEGVWCPALTPLDSDSIPDARRFGGHARWLLDQGCHGVVVFGTTGEAPSFSVQERMVLLESAVGAGLPPARLMVGNGCCALSDSVRLTIHALELGCTRFLMMPPFFFKNVSEEGLFRSYAEVIEQTASDAMRICLYHFPQLSGVPVTHGLIERLAVAYPGIIAGIKDSSGDADHTLDLIRRYPELAVFPGSDALLLRGIGEGGAGCIAATLNINPAAIRRVYDAFKTGDPEADVLHKTANKVREILDRYPLVSGLKQAMAHYHGDPAWLRMRPPLVPLGERDAGALLAALGAIGFVLAG